MSGPRAGPSAGSTAGSTPVRTPVSEQSGSEQSGSELPVSGLTASELGADQRAEFPYRTPTAFRTALRHRFNSVVLTDRRYSFDELARQFAYDRVLSRCFVGDDAELWVLKGAGALLARVPGARHSKDVDLFYDEQSAGPATAVAALTTALDLDVGDHFRFEIDRMSPLQEGVDGTRVHLRAFLGAPYAVFHVDVVVGTAMTRPPELVAPLTPLRVPGLVRPSYRAFPLVDHCADKLCAIVETHHQAGTQRVSTRVKDLVDLVLIASTQQVDAAALREAVLAGTAHRRIPVPPTFGVPDVAAWRSGYPKTARTARVPVASFDDAVVLVSAFFDPVLAGRVVGVWDPLAAAWTRPTDHPDRPRHQPR